MPATKFILIFFLLVCATLAATYYFFFPEIEDFWNTRETRHQFVLVEGHHRYGFDLVDPGQAPEENRESVKRGYSLMQSTPFFAPQYVGSDLSCTNCHFAEGDTIGGKNNGFSLVGVTTTYPRYSPRDGKVISLADRINNCFERSLNGKPLPTNSQEMKDLLNYLDWISIEVKHLKKIPWLGIDYLKSSHIPDPEQGQKIYARSCALCHGKDGAGGGKLPPPRNDSIPPLWGPKSFNDGAGMNNPAMIAAFIYWNMPYMQPFLTEDEAIDVAAFVLQQPRPHFEPNP